MNASNLYTRSRFGLDNRVWLALLITVFFSVALFAFKLTTHESCLAIELKVKDNEDATGSNYFPNDRLTFSASMKGLKDVSWDFGDNSPIIKGNNITHSFAHDGNYFITAIVNGKCRELMSIYVHPSVLAQTSVAVNNVEDIMGSDAPKAGEPAIYSTSLNGATYEWNVLNSPEYPTQKTPQVTYTFQSPGPKIIELRVGDKVVRKNIQVLPSDKPLVDPNANQMQQQQMQQQQQQQQTMPEETKPVASKSTFVADEVLKDLFEKVAHGDKDASSFAAYLCSGSATKVRENGEDWSTVGEFCTKIHDKKKYKIKSVVTIRDPNDKCILQIQISYKKGGFLGL